VNPVSAVVIGLGSIGQRHARVLGELGHDVATVSRRVGGDHQSVAQAIAASRPEYVVVATETSAHAKSLQQLAEAGFRGTVLVEKPVFSHSQPAPDYPFARLLVGYNLRFHPVMTAFAERLAGRQAITVSAYVGQDIRDWRPGRDHRATASATQQAGGGVLRDLSHELDYLLWLFGPWRRVAALGGSSGTRQIEVEDHLDLLLEMTGSAAVQVHMDYLDQPGIRKIRVNLAEETIEADMIGGCLTINGKIHDVPGERDESYRKMHLAAMNGGSEPICTFAEGLAVMDLIDASERALQSRTWISA
jgi:predicted dehydrogenase